MVVLLNPSPLKPPTENTAILLLPLLQSAMATNIHPFHHLFPRKSPSLTPLDSILIWSGVCERETGIMGWTEMGQKLSFELQMQQSNQPSIQWCWRLTVPSVCGESTARTGFILPGCARSSLCPSRTRVSRLQSKCTEIIIYRNRFNKH